LIIPALALQESQDFKVPQLRAIYQKMDFNNSSNAASIGGFGLVHDGTDPTVQVFLSRPVFTLIRNNTKIKNDIAAFVQCFDTGTAPAVGYTRTLVATNVNTAAISNDWSLLESQAALANIDLIAKGTVDGQHHGFLYQPLNGNYLPDTRVGSSFTRALLTAKIGSGDTLTIMGVPPGSGTPMGINRDEDSILDADEPPPRLNIARAGANNVLNWPYSAAGYNLESAAALPSAGWSNVIDPLEIVAGQNYTTNTPNGPASFYRLRLP
jgi:hypothetical protein